jgi:hypothetical protein
MSNPIKYSTGSETLALKKGNFYIGTGDVGKGPTSSTGYYNGITPPSGGYTIYLNKETGGPSIYTVSNDTQLISLTNSIAGTSYTTVNECLVYFAGQTDKMVLNRDYEGIVTDGLVLNLDAGFTPSYPKNGTTWYDLSGNNRHYTLKNGTSWSNGSFILDGVDDFIEGPPSNSFDIVQDHTIELVVKTTQIKQSVTFFWRSDNNRAILTHTPWDDGRIYYDIGGCCGGSQRIDYSNPNTLNNLMYYTYRTRSDVKPYRHIYQNGVAKVNSGNNENSTITFNSSPMIIGGEGSSISYKGHIYMLRVYNRALSDSEILQNFNAQKGRFGL